MIRLFIFTAIVLLPLFYVPAQAAEEVKKPQSVVRVPDKKEDAAIQKTPSGPVKEWIDAENAMIDKLNDPQKESIFILRSKYSIIRAINVVERDVGAAVKSCGKHNPDIKTKMEDRFGQWKNAVNPVIQAAKKQLDTDIGALKIVSPKEFRNVMVLNDKAFEYSEKQIQKSPSTTKDACEGLLASMNDTENNMIQTLRQTLLPESVIKSRAKAEEKAQAKGREKQDKKEKENKEPAPATP